MAKLNQDGHACRVLSFEGFTRPYNPKKVPAVQDPVLVMSFAKVVDKTPCSEAQYRAMHGASADRAMQGTPLESANECELEVT